MKLRRNAIPSNFSIQIRLLTSAPKKVLVEFSLIKPPSSIITTSFGVPPGRITSLQEWSYRTSKGLIFRTTVDLTLVTLYINPNSDGLIKEINTKLIIVTAPTSLIHFRTFALHRVRGIFIENNNPNFPTSIVVLSHNSRRNTQCSKQTKSNKLCLRSNTVLTHQNGRSNYTGDVLLILQPHN